MNGFNAAPCPNVRTITTIWVSRGRPSGGPTKWTNPGVIRINFTAKATATPPAKLVLDRPDEPKLRIDLDALPWLAFLQIGDDLAPVLEGWWLLGQSDGAIAVARVCGGIDSLMREGAFHATLGAIPEKYALFLMSRPLVLRGKASGVVELDVAQVAKLRADSITDTVTTMAMLPIIP